MSEAIEAPKAATLQELKSALPEASSDFLLAQLEASATLAVATKAYVAHQAAELKETKAKLAAAETAKAEAEKTKTETVKPAGQKTLGAGVVAAAADSTGDPVSQWNEAISAKRAAHKDWSNQQIVAAVNRENPGLRQSYLEASTAQRAGKVAA